MCQQATLCYGSGVAERNGGEKREKEKTKRERVGHPAGEMGVWT
jgi:hypothetical protein